VGRGRLVNKLNADPAKHRPILPIADRARITRRDRDWLLYCCGGSAEDPRQLFHH